jgi:hypothetical protein
MAEKSCLEHESGSRRGNVLLVKNDKLILQQSVGIAYRTSPNGPCSFQYQLCTLRLQPLTRAGDLISPVFRIQGHGCWTGKKPWHSWHNTLNRQAEKRSADDSAAYRAQGGC